MTTGIEHLIREGSLAWTPFQSASNLDVWNEFGEPAMGTFEYSDGAVLFYSTRGGRARRDLDDRVWTYLTLEPAEYSDLQNAAYDSMSEMEGDIESRLDGRNLVFAWSIHGVLQCSSRSMRSEKPWKEAVSDYRSALSGDGFSVDRIVRRFEPPERELLHREYEAFRQRQTISSVLLTHS